MGGNDPFARESTSNLWSLLALFAIDPPFLLLFKASFWAFLLRSYVPWPSIPAGLTNMAGWKGHPCWNRASESDRPLRVRIKGEGGGGWLFVRVQVWQLRFYATRAWTNDWLATMRGRIKAALRCVVALQFYAGSKLFMYNFYYWQTCLKCHVHLRGDWAP